MWRRSFEEDWERRKTYLIRSLFQDIPVLSPVAEEQVSSRTGTLSPSDVPPSRPYSPLPPLIIERVPNRHDHSEDFYRDLEKKMKKLYRKWFHNEVSSSIEDLIEMYGENLGSHSLIHDLQDYQLQQGNVIVDESMLTEVLPAVNGLTTSSEINKRISSEMKSSSERSFHANDKQSSDKDYSGERSCETGQSEGIASSDQSQFATQVTTVVDVHQEDSNEQCQTEKRAAYDEETLVLSPVFLPRRVVPNKKFVQKNILMQYEEENIEEDGSSDTYSTKSTGTSTETTSKIEEDKEKTSSGKTDRTEASDTSNGVMIAKDQNIHGDNSITTSDNNSLEQMRGRREVSLSLGSLPGDPIDVALESSSGLSVTYTDVDFQQKMSYEKDRYELNKSDAVNDRESLPVGLVDDNDSILSSSTGNSEDSEEARFINEISRRRSSLFIGDLLKQPKKKKLEDAAIQTSTSNAHEIFNNWNDLKNNFFVGVPKIYKLCACVDHSCKKEVEDISCYSEKTT